MLVIGQKVICVRDTWNVVPSHLVGKSVSLPRVGIEYVIRSTAPDGFTGGQAIRLHWLFLPLHPDGEEPSFGVFGIDGLANFEPVVEQTTDISIFTRMLAPSGRKVKERA